MTDASAPRSGAFFTSLTFAAAPFVAAPTITSVLELASQTRADLATHVAVCAGALVAAALLSRRLAPSSLVRLVRRLLLVATQSAIPTLLERASPGDAPALALWLCAALGALCGPEVATLVRSMRASSALGEDYTFERAGLSRTALVLCLATALCAAALPPYLGAGRSLVASAILLLPWAAFGAVESAATRPFLRLAFAVAASLGVGAGITVAGAERFALPFPRLLSPRTRLEATARIAPQAWLWSQRFGDESVLRVHGGDDLVHYEAADDLRFAEAAVHPAASLRPVRRALVLGNESGSVARELLKYGATERIVHVSFVPGLTRAFLEHPHLSRAHGGALADPRVVRLEAARADELPRLLAAEPPFDLIIAAAYGPLSAVKWLLGPNGRSLLGARVHPRGFTVRRLPSLGDASFAWCFVEEMARSGWHVRGYRLTLAGTTFDQFLLELASRGPFDPQAMRALRVPTRYLTDAHLTNQRRFGRDEAQVTAERPENCADELGVTE